MNYPINSFWSSRFGFSKAGTDSTVAGWNFNTTARKGFVEPDICLREGYEDIESKVWLVAAPGAVGKSTLARQIAAVTGAIYIDLAKAVTVAGNYLTGGLANSGLFNEWQSGSITAFIDALDEARLRITQNSFQDFLSDVVTRSTGRTLPVVLFGRVSIVDEAWIILKDLGVTAPIFNIEYFTQIQAKEFVINALENFSEQDKYQSLKKGLNSHRGNYESAIASVIADIASVAKDTTSNIADVSNSFAGYAPVLEAVATDLAGVSNIASYKSSYDRETVLHELSRSVLEREAIKLRKQLPESFTPEIRSTIYTPEEQLVRLASRILTTQCSSTPHTLPQSLVSGYESVVNGFLPQHPFLDGLGQHPSNAVFSAVICAKALLEDNMLAVAAERYSGSSPHSPNPFLIDCYLKRFEDTYGIGTAIQLEHVVLLYESFRARAKAGDAIQLLIEGDPGETIADVEIRANDTITHTYKCSQHGILLFGRAISTVDIFAPSISVIIGGCDSVEVISPCTFDVGALEINCQELIIHGSQDADGKAVFLTADEYSNKSTLKSVPIIRNNAELFVSWPNNNIFPWTRFANTVNSNVQSDTDKRLQAFRRLVLAFRSHSRGGLARLRAKIDHARIAKNGGAEIRLKLIEDDILTIDNIMYRLDPDKLGKVTGATYRDLTLQHYKDEVRNYLHDIFRDD